MDEKSNRLVFFGAVLILLLYTSLRYEVGADWDYYNYIFNQSNWDYVWGNLKVEPLFVLLCMLVKWLGGELFAVTFIVSVATVLLFAKSIFDYSKMPMLTFFLFMLPFFLLGISQIRQGLSLAILLFAFRYVEQRRLLPFLILVSLGTGFHFSALFFFPVYLIFRMKVPVWVSISLILALLLFDSLVRFDFLVKVSSLTFEHIHYKFFAYYHNDSLFAIQTKSLYWRLMVFGIVLYYDYNKGNSRTNLLKNIYLLGILYFILLSSFPSVANRGSLCCKVFEIFIISDFLYYLRKEKRHILLAVILSISVMYFSRQLFNHFTNDKMRIYMDYKTIFHKTP